ncbi:MAG: hypothetical protein NTV52_25845, partial [Acidobacteria bacterium]|nr:hypothetical protein [Acidobacteriota bacterium]
MTFRGQGQSVRGPHIGAGRVRKLDIETALAENQIGSLLAIFRLIEGAGKAEGASITGIGHPKVPLSIGNDAGRIKQTGIVENIGIVVRRIHNSREAIGLADDDIGQIARFYGKGVG